MISKYKGIGMTHKIGNMTVGMKKRSASTGTRPKNFDDCPLKGADDLTRRARSQKCRDTISACSTRRNKLTRVGFLVVEVKIGGGLSCWRGARSTHRSRQIYTILDRQPLEDMCVVQCILSDSRGLLNAIEFNESPGFISWSIRNIQMRAKLAPGNEDTSITASNGMFFAVKTPQADLISFSNQARGISLEFSSAQRDLLMTA